MKHYYVYLDESGPFDDPPSETFPVSVVGGLISEHALDNQTVRPVLDRICAFGNHDLRHQDLHCIELRERLGPEDYCAWATNALQSIGDFGPDTHAVVFRNTEGYRLSDVDTTYLFVLVEGLSQLIPALLGDTPGGRARVSVVLENRRVMRDARGGRRDSAVPRVYVALEDYATRLRTHLKLEMIRQNRGDAFNALDDLAIRISDPATDKALNFADFVCHHARFSYREHDRETYERGLKPHLRYDIPVVLNLTFQAAERLARQHRFGEALFALVSSTGEQRPAKRAGTEAPRAGTATESLTRNVFATLTTAPSGTIERAVEDYLERVRHLAQSDADGDGEADAVRYLKALRAWAEARSGTPKKPRGAKPALTRAIERTDLRHARQLAWQWGAFRAHAELLSYALARGDLDDAREHREACRPLVARFIRSIDHTPRVFAFLLDAAWLDALAANWVPARQAFDAVVRFHGTLEEWWVVDLPELMPELAALTAEHLYDEPQGRARLRRARAVTRQVWLSGASDAEREQLTGQARDDFKQAIDEFRTPSEQAAAALVHARFLARAGDGAQAFRWLAHAAGMAALAGAEAPPAAEVARLIESLCTMADPAFAVTALCEVTVAATGSLQLSLQGGAALGLERLLGVEARGDALGLALQLDRARGRLLVAAGKPGPAREHFHRAPDRLRRGGPVNVHQLLAASCDLESVLATERRTKKTLGRLDSAVARLRALARAAKQAGFTPLSAQATTLADAIHAQAALAAKRFTAEVRAALAALADTAAAMI